MDRDTDSEATIELARLKATLTRSAFRDAVARRLDSPGLACRAHGVGTERISLSKQKWQWMSERNVDALTALFHEDAVFVHIGGTISRTQELDVIKSGGIHYKQADIQEVSVKIIGTTAILLNRIRLVPWLAEMRSRIPLS